MLRPGRSLITLLIAASLAPAASAELIEVDLTSIMNNGVLGDGSNMSFTLPVGPGQQIVGLGLDGTLTTFGNSLVSQAAIFVGSEPGTGAELEGLGPAIPGSSFQVSTFGVLPVSFLGYDPVAIDGSIYIEFYDVFDDVVGGTDSLWTGGTLVIDVQPVPGPAAFAIFGLVAACSRRRRGNA